MIIGIDPSLTNTAVVIGTESQHDVRCFGSDNQGDHVAGRIARYESLVARIMAEIERGKPAIDLIVMEAYSFGSNDARAKFSAEYGGILRFHLVELTDRIYEVAPMTLKKFATGAGKGDKDMIAAHLTKRYDVMLKNNDEYDAFALFQMGLIIDGRTQPQTTAQAEAIATVMGEKPAKKPKRAKKEPQHPLPF
jgi:crossover junction endodeoxyribonuclease RuvC